MPDRLARELILHCIGTARPTTRADELLRMLISALGEVPVRRAHIAAEGDGSRHAVVVVDADQATELAHLLPRAVLLQGSPRGTSIFRISATDLHPR